MDFDLNPGVKFLGASFAVITNVVVFYRVAYARSRIEHFLVGHWEGDMRLNDESKDRSYKFFASFYKLDKKLIGRLFYKGKQGLANGDKFEFIGFDTLTSHCQDLDRQPKKGHPFCLIFDRDGHIKTINNKMVFDQTEAENILVMYNCAIKSWILGSEIQVEVGVGDEGRKLIGTWKKQ